MTARRAGTTAVAAVVATALLVLVLAAWASSIGPSDVLTGPGPSPAGTPSFEETPLPETGDLTPAEDAKKDRETPGWVRTVAFLINVAAAALVVSLVLRSVGAPLVKWGAGRRRARRRRRGRAVADETDFAVLQPSEAV